MTEIEARKLLAELVEKKKSMTLYELEKIGECLRHAMGTPASLGIVYIDEWISYAKAVQFVAGSQQEFLLRKLSEAENSLSIRNSALR